MNWAAFHLASRKELHQAGKNERFLKTERGQKKEIVSKKKKKKSIVSGRITLLRGTEGTYEAEYLISADQVISSWLKITFLGEAVIAVGLGIKSWFAKEGF